MRGAMLLGPERIEIREVPVPRPRSGEVLLKIRAATTCGTDVKVYRRGGHPRMLKVPTLFGHEMAGTVADVGPDVDQFYSGDDVVVANSASCGVCLPCRSGRENLCQDLHYLNGAFAQYILIPKRFVAGNTYRIPPGLAFDVAALTEPLACVLHGIEACDLRRLPPGATAEIVIYGAGPIGLLFVAALSRLGHHVILSDPNPSRLEVGVELGAAETIGAERGGGQYARVIARTQGGIGAQVAIDCTGLPEVWEDAIASVKPGGQAILFGGCAPETRIRLDTHRLHYDELTVKGVYHHRPANVREAIAMLASPDFEIRPLLTGQCGINGVEDALRRMMRREALKVVIRDS